MKALVDRLRALPAADRTAILAGCSARELAALQWAWREFWARPDRRSPTDPTEGEGQLAPAGRWTWWGSIGGRGSGKTRSAAEWVTEEAMRLGRGCIIHLVGATPDDARATMIEGDSGLATCAPPWAGFDFKSSVEGGVCTWRSGARARVFGADKPSKGRGPQCNRMWLDDPAAYGPKGLATLQQLLWGFRKRAPDGSEPRGVISSTPIESELMEWILGAEAARAVGRKMNIVYSRSATDDNRANLSESFFEETIAEFAGTELEQQERFGRLDLSAARKVFAGVDFNAHRAVGVPERLMYVAIWCDPAVSTSTKACECGVVVAGMDYAGHVYLLEDLSGVMGATASSQHAAWPEVAIDAAVRWGTRADRVWLGVETNRGTNQPEGLLRSAEVIYRLRAGQPGVSVLEVRTIHTDKSKATRATPLPRLFQAGQVHLVGRFEELERQLRLLDDTPRQGRDRADAAVYAVLDLVGLLNMARAGGGVAMVAGAAAVAPTERVGPAPLASVVVGQPMAQPARFQFGAPARAGAR